MTVVPAVHSNNNSAPAPEQRCREFLIMDSFFQKPEVKTFYHDNAETHQHTQIQESAPKEQKQRSGTQVKQQQGKTLE